jgi:hypothetical protein
LRCGPGGNAKRNRLRQGSDRIHVVLPISDRSANIATISFAAEAGRKLLEDTLPNNCLSLSWVTAERRHAHPAFYI